MRLYRSSSWIAWALICTQSLLLVLGHGRIVVCHEDGGTSHVEIVGEDSCSILVTDGCSQPVASQDEIQQISSPCSDTSCTDVPLGITATISNARMTSSGEQQGILPPPSLAIVDWLVLQDPMEKPDCTIDFDDQHAIAGLHRSNRSTILVL